MMKMKVFAKICMDFSGKGWKNRVAALLQGRLC